MIKLAAVPGNNEEADGIAQSLHTTRETTNFEIIEFGMDEYQPPVFSLDGTLQMHLQSDGIGNLTIP